MPGVSRADMNGYRDFEHGHLRTSSYANGYDPYRRDDRNGYRRNNGIEEFEQNSFEAGMRDGNELSFEVDHLATYTSKSGTTHPEDGLNKLKQMESSTGIWTMRCLMIIERRHIIIIDKGNGDELERFPLAQLHEPTAVLKNDRKETYTNLVLFTVIDDPRRKNSPSDMHIFQSVNTPAHDIVDEILAAKGEGGGRRGPYNDRHIPPPPSGPAPEPPYGRGGFGATTRASYIHNSDMDTGQNEAMEKDVQLLNNCFDDIEKFVSRLQQAAEAYKELERRRLERGGKKNRKSAGDGMLMMRARPPPADDFVDIFQKFKFAFNLLAKLKAHIHDPNAPELVHFLFTPLSLIYEASRDPIHGGAELSGEAIAPLLLPDAKQLLLNCLTSKELELWQRLGKPWTLVKDEWHGYVPQYNPRFYNGWQPSPAAVDDVNYPGDRFRDEPPLIRPSERNVPYDDNRVSRRREEPYAREIRKSEREDPYSRDIRSTARDDYHSDRRGEDLRPTRNEYRSTERWDDYRSPSPPPPMRQTDYSENKRASAREPIPAAPRSRAEENSAFAKELGRMGATIYEAVHERQGKNAKEMNVEKGDIVQVLDKSRNWWKLKNYMGETGYAPYTILKEYQSRDDYDNGQGRLSGDYSSYINGNAPPPPPPPMSGSNRGGMRAEKDKRSSPRYQPQAPPAPPKSRAPERGKYSDELHHELRTKMNTSDDHLTSYGPRSPRNPPRETKVSQYSSAEEVKDWLENKGFSMRCMDLLQGYSGIDLFSLERQELERLLGREDGRHLDSLLTVQKKNAGYRTHGTSELGAILQRRKERADDDVMGMRPSFAPDSPDYSPAESDASSDDFGDAGKTLRNLLERQRKKIQSGSYQKYN